MNTPIYLWNEYATRRHIQDPDDDRMYDGRPIALCKTFFRTRSQHEHIYRRWNTADQAQKYIDKMDSVPVCLKCEKKFGAPKRTVDFYVYRMGVGMASACTSLDNSNAEKRMNRENPTGIDSRWTVSKETTFAKGEPHPGKCEDSPDTHRHLLMEC
jgi:hypothetical protein